MEFEHISVLLNECINSLNIKQDGVYIDGTAGGAGHSLEIAKRLKDGKLFALDRDPDAVKASTERLGKYKNAKVIKANFCDMKNVLENEGVNGVDGVLLDLGVSSHQLDTAERGFSYHTDAPLDMRMSQSGITAKDIVNTYSPDDLTRILLDYGEEKFARRIALKIDEKRKIKPIETTLQLAEIIKEAYPAAARREKNPCKRSFQAIRIAVNSELEALKEGLEGAFSLLNPGGRIAVITFHSLEDRIVKQIFLNWCKGCTCPPDFPVCVCGNKPKARLVNKKPITASGEELSLNNRSRSAKLRVIEKL